MQILKNFSDSWVSRLNKTHLVRNACGYQLVKPASLDVISTEVFLNDDKLYALEVDCETHSFVANNFIVHDSTPCTPVYAPAQRGIYKR
jgi:hypothetical protein